MNRAAVNLFVFFLLVTCLVTTPAAVIFGGLYSQSVAQAQALADERDLAIEGKQQAIAEKVAEFYRGMYYLCWDANQGHGYMQSEVIYGCNKLTQEQREMRAHLDEAEGYKP